MFHRASSILEDNASQHPVQSPGVVDVSPVDLGVHKGQKILVSVNVVLVLELHFNFISEDSDKTLTLLQVIWQREAGLMFVLVCPAKKVFVQQSTFN